MRVQTSLFSSVSAGAMIHAHSRDGRDRKPIGFLKVTGLDGDNNAVEEIIPQYADVPALGYKMFKIVNRIKTA